MKNKTNSKQKEKYFPSRFLALPAAHKVDHGQGTSLPIIPGGTLMPLPLPPQLEIWTQTLRTASALTT